MKPLSCFLAVGVTLSCVASAADSYESLRQETRQAIARGNAWLKNQQKADGFWDDPELPAITALALNAAVRDPNLKAGEKLPAHLDKGFSWLIAQQKEDGGIYNRGLSVYNTATSLTALTSAARRSSAQKATSASFSSGPRNQACPL